MAEPISFEELVDRYADRKEAARKEPLEDSGIKEYLKANGLHLRTAMQFPAGSFWTSMLEGLTAYTDPHMRYFRNGLEGIGVNRIEGSPEDYTQLVNKLGEGADTFMRNERVHAFAKNLDFFHGFSPSVLQHLPSNGIEALWKPDRGGFNHLSHLMGDSDFRAQIINMIRKRAKQDDHATANHAAALAHSAKGKITPQELEELSGIVSKNLGDKDGLQAISAAVAYRNVPELFHAYLNHDGFDTSQSMNHNYVNSDRNLHPLHEGLLDYVRNGKHISEDRRKFALEYALARGAAPKMTDDEFHEAVNLQADNRGDIATQPLADLVHDNELSEGKIKAAHEAFLRIARRPNGAYEWNSAISALPIVPLSREAVENVLENTYGRAGKIDHTTPASLGYFLKPEEVDQILEDAKTGPSSSNKMANIANMLLFRKVHNAYGADLTPKQEQWLEEEFPDWKKRLKKTAEFAVSKNLRMKGLGNGYINTPEDLMSRLDAINDQETPLSDVLDHPAANHDVISRLMRLSNDRNLRMSSQTWSLGSSKYSDEDRLKRLFQPDGNPNKSLANGLYGKPTYVKVGSSSLRKLRDHLQNTGSELRPEELPKPEKGVSWNSIVKEIRDRHGNVNYVQDWTPLRAPSGKLSHEAVSAYIDKMPVREFSVADDRTWNHSLQNHSADPTNILSVNLTSGMAQKLKDSGLWDEFVDLSVGDHHRAHPTSNHSIGWTRYSVNDDEKSIFIDECQSDLLGEYRKHMASGVSDEKKAKYKKVWDMVFGKDHPSEVVFETAHQHFRDQGMHDYTVSTHTVDSKRGVSIDKDPKKAAPAHMNETYKNVPKKMGMESGEYGKRITETGDGDYDLVGKPVHVGQIRKAEDPNETFPEFLDRQIAKDPVDFADRLLPRVRLAIGEYLTNHPDGREITLKDYEHVLNNHKDMLNRYADFMDWPEEIMNRKLLTHMAMPGTGPKREGSELRGSSELASKIMDDTIVHGAKLDPATFRDLVGGIKLTPEVIEKALQVGEKIGTDAHNTLLRHPDTKEGESGIQKYREVIEAITKNKPLKDVLKNSNEDSSLKDAHGIWNELITDLMWREEDAPQSEKAKYKSILSGLTSSVDFGDDFFTDPSITSMATNGLRHYLLMMSDKKQLNKYLDGLVAKENSGKPVTDFTQSVLASQHPHFGLNELLKLDKLGTMPHVLPDTISNIGEGEMRAFHNGKVPAEKVAEMLKHPSRNNRHYHNLISALADLTPYDGKIPDWFPTYSKADPELSIYSMATKNPTYKIPKEAIGQVFETNSKLPAANIIEQGSPEFKAELAKIASAVAKHNENHAAKYGERPSLNSYSYEAPFSVKDSSFTSDVDEIAKQNGIDTAKDLLGKFINYPEALQKLLFSYVQDSHPEVAARLAQSVSGATGLFGAHLSRPDTTGDEGNYDINPKVLGHIKDESLLQDLDDSNFLDHSAEGLPPEVLERVKEKHGKEFRRSVRDMSNQGSVSIPHLDSQQAATDIIEHAAKSGNLDELFSQAEMYANADRASVKRNSEPLRYLRDYLEQMQKDGKEPVIDPKELPKDKTFNSITSVVRSKSKDGSETESRVLDWNPLRDPKKGGKVTLQSVQNYIDSMPETKFNVSHTYWSGAQRHNQDHSNVMVVGLTDDHVNKIKEAGLWPAFMRVSSRLPHSHPQHPFALGWIRYTGAGGERISGQNKRYIEANPEAHVFVDEIQSDLMKGINKLKPEKAKKLSEILFGGTHPSELLHEVFQDMARKNGLVGKIVRIHSSESKAPISLGRKNDPVPVHFTRTYEDIPKKKLNAEPSTYGHPDFSSEDPNGDRASENTETLKGKRIWQSVFRKSEEYSDWDDA